MSQGLGLLTPQGLLPDYLAGRTLRIDLREACIVGILNVTPDSFSDGGRFSTLERALEHARKMVAEGAGLIDVGGESTRPGAPAVSSQEELDRVIPLLEALQGQLPVPLSIDTRKSAVAEAAIAAGVEFVNDVSGLLYDEAMTKTVSASGVGLFIMHSRGEPAEMQSNTRYADVVRDVSAALGERVEFARQGGVAMDKIAIDPGIGFAKDVAGNLELLRQTATLAALGRPVMLGTSRKSFIGKVLAQSDPGQRLAGTLATIALGYAGGARIFRVHDVAAACQAAAMARAVCCGSEWPAC